MLVGLPSLSIFRLLILATLATQTFTPLAIFPCQVFCNPHDPHEVSAPLALYVYVWLIQHRANLAGFYVHQHIKTHLLCILVLIPSLSLPHGFALSTHAPQSSRIGGALSSTGHCNQRPSGLCCRPTKASTLPRVQETSHSLPLVRRPNKKGTAHHIIPSNYFSTALIPSACFSLHVLY